MARKRKITQERINELMERVPELPKSFNDWAIKNSMPESKYVFYRKKGKKTYGVCSCCGERVVYQNNKRIKHNGKGYCRNCKQRITFKAINKAMYYDDNGIVSIMQRMKDRNCNQYVIRYFEVFKSFKRGDDTSNFPDEILDTLINPRYSIWEGSREILTIQDDGSTKLEVLVEKVWNYESGTYLWRKERKRSWCFNKKLLRDSQPFIYRRNLKSLLKNTKWKYCGLDHFKGTCMNIGDYIRTYEECPAIEMLCKIGANRLLFDVIEDYVSWGGGSNGYIDTNKKFLGVDKKIFQRAVKLGIHARKIEFLVILEELNYKLTDEQVLWAIEYTNTEVFTQLLRYASANKVISYLDSQARSSNSRYSSPVNIAINWRDYLDQCNELGFDLKKSYFLFPNNLEERHTEYTKLLEARTNEVINEGIIKTFNAWRELDYEEGIYKIVVARNQKMIIAEGAHLGHCVGSTTYTAAMAKGDKIILMLRKNNKPYTTIEFSPKLFKVLQNRGEWNQDRPDAIEFADKWLKNHVEKIRVKRLSEKAKKTIMSAGAVTGGKYGNSERVAI